MPPKTVISYYDQALKLLSNRPHAEKELRLKLNNLSKKRYNRRQYKKRNGLHNGQFSSVFVNESTPDDDQNEIEEAISRVKNEGFLNDRSFAEWYCLQRQDYNPRSGRNLYMELVMKGVSPTIVKEVMKEYHSEEQSCKDIALKKSVTMTREKLTTYLLGKGFRLDTIQRVLRSISTDLE